MEQKAEVIVYNGQIIDVVLLYGGSGYQQSPTVTVSRGYDVIKNSNRKIAFSDGLGSGGSGFPTIANKSINLEISGFSLIHSSVITTQLARLEHVVTEAITIGGDQNLAVDTNLTANIQIIQTPGIEDKKLDTQVVIFIGVFDTFESSSVVSVNNEFFSFIDIPFDLVSSSSILSTERYVTREINKLINNAIIETASYSINDVGAFLDIGLTELDTIVYISDTAKFPDSGRLLIGKEIVTYDKKLSDRFLNVTRGFAETTITSHNAGDYLRHLPELISIVSAGPIANIITEIKITEIHSTNSSITRIISSLSDEVVNVLSESTEVTHYYNFGAVDYFENSDLNYYSLGNAGFTLKAFENNAFIDTGVLNINGTLESFSLAYPDVMIKDFEERPGSSITLTGVTFKLGIPTINSVGTMITSDINNSQTTIPVVTTERFATSGSILVGSEIIFYTSKNEF